VQNVAVFVAQCVAPVVAAVAGSQAVCRFVIFASVIVIVCCPSVIRCLYFGCYVHYRNTGSAAFSINFCDACAGKCMLNHYLEWDK